MNIFNFLGNKKDRNADIRNNPNTIPEYGLCSYDYSLGQRDELEKIYPGQRVMILNRNFNSYVITTYPSEYNHYTVSGEIRRFYDHTILYSWSDNSELYFHINKKEKIRIFTSSNHGAMHAAMDHYKYCFSGGEYIKHSSYTIAEYDPRKPRIDWLYTGNDETIGIISHYGKRTKNVFKITKGKLFYNDMMISLNIKDQYEIKNLVQEYINRLWIIDNKEDLDKSLCLKPYFYLGRLRDYYLKRPIFDFSQTKENSDYVDIKEWEYV